MIKSIKHVLTEQQINALSRLIAQGDFKDGRNTAGWHAKGVKNNLQWSGNEHLSQELDQALTLALSRHPEFTAHAYPKK